MSASGTLVYDNTNNTLTLTISGLPPTQWQQTTTPTLPNQNIGILITFNFNSISGLQLKTNNAANNKSYYDNNTDYSFKDNNMANIPSSFMTITAVKPNVVILFASQLFSTLTPITGFELVLQNTIINGSTIPSSGIIAFSDIATNVLNFTTLFGVSDFNIQLQQI